MAVGNETIIRKMINELDQAKDQQLNQGKMLEHIENVRLLCGLFLDDDSSVSNKSDISTEEMQKMIGKQASDSKPDKTKKSTIDHDVANGNSIFDF